MDFKNILITGGCGFIGSHIVDYMLEKNFRVKIVDNLSTGFKKNVEHHKDNKNVEVTITFLGREMLKDANILLLSNALAGNFADLAHHELYLNADVDLPFDFILKNYYLSDAYKNKEDIKLSLDEISNLIIYQSGNSNFTLNQSKEFLVGCALVAKENNEDPIDYLYLCLCGRPTKTEELNRLLIIYKTKESEKDSLMAVLEEIMKDKSFLFK